MEKYKCYLDDYNTIKLYVDKNLNQDINDLKLFKDDLLINYQLAGCGEYQTMNKYIITFDDYCFDSKYQLVINEVCLTPVYRHIVNTERFDREFYYGDNDLGSDYHQEFTTFKLWSPLATTVNLILVDLKLSIPMKKNAGVFECMVKGDLDCQSYLYEIEHQNFTVKSIDPYSYSSTCNGEYSVVVNLEQLNLNKVALKTTITSNVDAIIYELSVRDFTINNNSKVMNKGKFLGLIEEGTNLMKYPTGFDYLKSLGITHIQLLPVFDFDSYDENNYPKEYNWGYDPYQFNVLEGSYLTKDDPYSRINEFKHLVDIFHKADIRVNLDVVFNHVGHIEDYAWHKIIPYYAFRYGDDEILSNGSFCGNEIRSEAKMFSKYIVDMCNRYVDIYDIDGLRFDLMGLLDIETMNNIFKTIVKKKADFMVYGEGWDMPSSYDSFYRATMYNNAKTPNIAYFNDRYRDVVKGATALNDIGDVGFGLGNLEKKNLVRDLIGGSILNGHFLSASQTVNYLECHDNMTFYDKMNNCLNDDEYTKTQKTKLSLAILMLSQGIPFIHCGQEFMRNKKGYDNTYNLSDEINAIDWYQMIRKIDVVNYFRSLIKIRRQYPQFRLNDDEIKKALLFEDYYEVLIYKINNLKVLINASAFNHKYPITRCKLIFDDGIKNEIITDSELKLSPFSLIVIEEV